MVRAEYRPYLLLSPALLSLAFLLLAPIIFIFVYSFWLRQANGLDVPAFQFSNWRSVLGDSFYWMGLRETFVEIFGGVFFDVETRDADALFCAGDFDFDVAGGGERKLELGNLVALGKVGIEIIFAGEAGVFMDGAVEGERGAAGHFDDAFI